MSTPRRFPELAQFETKEERRAVYGAAIKKVSRRPRFWLSLIVGVGFITGTVIIIFDLILKPILAMPSWMNNGFFGGLIAGSYVGLHQFVFRRAIEKEIRLEMIARGLSDCMGCGYDLRAQVEPRYPECGMVFSRQGG